MSDEILPDKVRRGRVSKWLFTQTPQWALLMCELSDAGYRIYSLLLAHVNVADDDGEVWPQQQTMADMLDRHRNSISRVVTKELEPLGLVEVEVERYGTNNTRRRNIYVVHELPPEGFTGWASVSEWYAAHPRPKAEPTNRRERKTAGQPGRTKNGASGDTKNSASGRTESGASGRTKNSAVTRRRVNKTKGESSSLPLPPSDRPASPAPAGREDVRSAKKTHTPSERALEIVEAAVRLWPSNHAAPSEIDKQRLAGRVDAELASDGEERFIIRELSRDMRSIHTGAMQVMWTHRTAVPGWGRNPDPRPDHAQYEIDLKHPWCGQCSEKTRMVHVIVDEVTGDTRPKRCSAPVIDHHGQRVPCHPQGKLVETFPEPAEEAVEDPEGGVSSAIAASLEEARTRAKQEKNAELAATRALLANLNSGAEKEKKTRVGSRR